MKSNIAIRHSKFGSRQSAVATRRFPGFTLIELLLVMTIITILVGVVARALMKAETTTAYKRAQAEIRAMELALQQYKADYGVYPLSSTTAPPTFTQPAYPATIGGTSARGSGTTTTESTTTDQANVEAAVAKNAASLWYYLYQARIDISKAPYMTFSTKQLVQYSGTSWYEVVDPWGKPYNYDAVSAARENRATFDLFSAGANGRYEWIDTVPTPDIDYGVDNVTNWESH